MREENKSSMIYCLFLLALFFVAGKSTAQINITGPVCAVPNITYQYIIKGDWTDSLAVQACLTGGKFSTGETCLSGAGNKMSVLSVIWSDTSFMKIVITSSNGNSTLVIKPTTNLYGGMINENDNVQVYDSTAKGYNFHCEYPSGGSCNPVYTYQWQKSENAVNWVDIKGAAAKDLFFTDKILVNTYFRRVTLEKNSSSVAYSNQGLLVVVF